MAQRENSLGAPTEGLGQNVTFAFDTSGVPQLSLPGRGGVNGGVQGGIAHTSTQGTQVGMSEDPTMAALMKVGDAIMRPMMEKKKVEAYVTGMQRAMAGETIKDIAETQPWYSKLFGDSDVVEGARAYTGHTVAQTTIASMQDQMPEIRKMGPAEAQQYYTKAVQKNLTGDGATDLSIMKAMTSALPGVMREQSRQHYGWLQENAAASESAAFNAGADAFQRGAAKMAQGYMTKDELDAQSSQFVRSLLPAKGRDIKNWRESMTDNLERWAGNGQFHALNSVLDHGLLDALTPDQQMKVKNRIITEEGKTRARYSYEWSDQKAKIEALAHDPDQGQKAQDAAKLALEANKKFAEETGVRTMQFFSPEELTNLTKTSAIAITRERARQAEIVQRNAEKAATAAGKAQAAEDKLNLIRSNPQAVADFVAFPGFSNEDVNAAMVPLYNSKDAAGKVELLTKMYSGKGYVLKLIADGKERAVEALVSGGDNVVKDYGAGAEQAYNEYKQMRAVGPEMAAAYYGKQAPRMEKLYSLIEDAKMPPKFAWQSAMLTPLKAARIDASVMKATSAQVLSQQPGWIVGTVTGSIPLSETGQRLVSNVASGYADSFKDMWGDKVAAERGINLAKGSGQLTVLGGHAWTKQKSQPDLQAYLASTHDGKRAVGTDGAGEITRDAIDTLLYGSGKTAGIIPNAGFHIGTKKADAVSVFQDQDNDGRPVLHVMATVDGEVKTGVLPFSRVFDLYHEQQELKKVSTLGIKNENLRFGPDLSGPKAPARQPSIYASKEEWARYRAEQAQQPK